MTQNQSLLLTYKAKALLAVDGGTWFPDHQLIDIIFRGDWTAVERFRKRFEAFGLQSDITLPSSHCQWWWLGQFDYESWCQGKLHDKIYTINLVLHIMSSQYLTDTYYILDWIGSSPSSNCNRFGETTLPFHLFQLDRKYQMAITIGHWKSTRKGNWIDEPLAFSISIINGSWKNLSWFQSAGLYNCSGTPKELRTIQTFGWLKNLSKIIDWALSKHLLNETFFFKT